MYFGLALNSKKERKKAFCVLCAVYTNTYRSFRSFINFLNLISNSFRISSLQMWMRQWEGWRKRKMEKKRGREKTNILVNISCIVWCGYAVHCRRCTKGYWYTNIASNRGSVGARLYVEEKTIHRETKHVLATTTPLSIPNDPPVCVQLVPAIWMPVPCDSHRCAPEWKSRRDSPWNLNRSGTR